LHNHGPSFPGLNLPPRNGGRGRGRRHKPQPFLNANNQVTISDRNHDHLHNPINNVLHLNLTPSKHFHAFINAAGGITTAGIYNLDFDNGSFHYV
jgi:hypothetical protein